MPKPSEMKMADAAPRAGSVEPVMICGVDLNWRIKMHPSDLGEVMKSEECRFVGDVNECAEFIVNHKSKGGTPVDVIAFGEWLLQEVPSVSHVNVMGVKKYWYHKKYEYKSVVELHDIFMSLHPSAKPAKTAGWYNASKVKPLQGELVWVWSQDGKMYLCRYERGGLWDKEVAYRNVFSKFGFKNDAKYWQHAMPEKPNDNNIKK